MNGQSANTTSFTLSENELTQYKQLIYKVWGLLSNNWIKYSYRNELLSAGLDGLIYAAKTWTPERGEKSTYYPIVIRHEIYKALRKIIRENNRILNIDEPVPYKGCAEPVYIADILIDESENIEERAINKDLYERILKAVSRCCTEREKLILYLYCVEYKSYTDIAKEFGISKQRINQKIKNIRKKILKMIEK